MRKLSNFFGANKKEKTFRASTSEEKQEKKGDILGAAQQVLQCHKSASEAENRFPGVSSASSLILPDNIKPIVEALTNQKVMSSEIDTLMENLINQGMSDKLNLLIEDIEKNPVRMAPFSEHRDILIRLQTELSLRELSSRGAGIVKTA